MHNNQYTVKPAERLAVILDALERGLDVYEVTELLGMTTTRNVGRWLRHAGAPQLATRFETPESLVATKAEERLALIAESFAAGNLEDAVAADVGISVAGLARWLHRHGHVDLAKRFDARLRVAA